MLGVSALLQIPGIDVNAANQKGTTTCHLLCEYGFVDCLRLLLQVPGLQVNAADDFGWTPLHKAAAAGQEVVVQLLLTHPALNIQAAKEALAAIDFYAVIDVHVHEAPSLTALQLAQKHGHREVERLIQDALNALP